MTPDQDRPENEAHDAVGAVAAGHGRPGWLRRLYDWVLHWADTPHGITALFLLAAAESSFFPIPPDPLLIALCLGASKRSLKFAGVATLASVVGGIIGYGIGAGGWTLLEGWFFTYVPGVSAESFARVQGLYDRYDFWAIFLAGLTPIPYKVFTIAGGVCRISFTTLVVASIIGRSGRFFLVGGLIYLFGDAVRTFIEKYLGWLTIAFTILLIAGFIAVNRLMH